ncbi:hypothetical protein [Nocardia gipuzkoensis]
MIAELQNRGDLVEKGLGPLAHELGDAICGEVVDRSPYRGRPVSHRSRSQERRSRRAVGRHRRAVNSTGPRAAHIDETAQVLRTLAEYRDDLIRTRTQTANRLHGMLARLVPAGLPKRLTAQAASQLLRSVRRREHCRRTLRQTSRCRPAPRSSLASEYM